LVLEVPTKDRFVSGAAEQVGVIRENLDFGDFACVFLQVGNEFSRLNFPDSDFALHASRGNELEVVAEVNGSHSVLVSVVNLPQLLVVVHSESSNSSVRPPWDHNLISELSAESVDVLKALLVAHKSSSDAVVIGIPQSHSPIFGAGDEPFRLAIEVADWNNRESVVFREQHVGEITDPQAVNEALVGGSQHLNSICAYTHALNRAIELSLQ
jgi:hypothetical protein